jgi:hypothetical protein
MTKCKRNTGRFGRNSSRFSNNIKQETPIHQDLNNCIMIMLYSLYLFDDGHPDIGVLGQLVRTRQARRPSTNDDHIDLGVVVQVLEVAGGHSAGDGGLTDRLELETIEWGGVPGDRWEERGVEGKLGRCFDEEIVDCAVNGDAHKGGEGDVRVYNGG